MAFQETHHWTLGGLIAAFIDLTLAYFLLCGSAIAFFASKFLRIFGFHIPCPCKGFFGYRNSNFCLHKLLFDWPSREICSAQVMAVKRFPFDVLNVKDQSEKQTRSEKQARAKISESKVLELEDEASCSSCSGSHLLSLVDWESGYDAKGKRTMNVKRRSGIRRKRRATSESGKFSPVFPYEKLQSDVARVSNLPFDGNITGGITGESKEVSVADVEDALTGHEVNERICGSYEFGGSLENSPVQEKYLSPFESHTTKAQDKVHIVGNEENRIKMLEEALEEQKAAYAALYLELEIERAAAATAADEAMAMISRLQEEKAAIEMETRQFHRMVEERVSFDEEEMNIMQEILMRREMEIHFLEKELESYRPMNIRGIELSKGESKVMLDEQGKRTTFLLETQEDPQQAESGISTVKKMEFGNHPSNYMEGGICISSEDGEEQAKNRACSDKIHGSLLSSFIDTKPNVLDVHIIDDNVEVRKDEYEKISASSLDSSSNGRYNDHVFGNLEVQSRNIASLSNHSRISRAESDIGIDLTSQLSVLSNSSCKNVRRSSSCDVNEKLKIGTEIERLGEKLRMIQHQKGKLTFTSENGESRNGQLKLLEELASQLQEIKQLRNPLRGTGASLPPSSAKASLKNRRCQSSTLEMCESA